MRDIGGHDRTENRAEGQEGAASGKGARIGEGERDKKGEDGDAARRLAPPRLGEIIVTDPADEQREQHEQDGLPRLQRQDFGIDQIEIGLQEIGHGHQREAGEPDGVGLPAEPADPRLRLGRQIDVARNAEHAVVRRAPDVGLRRLEREVELQEAERKANPEDGGNDVQPPQEEFAPVVDYRDDVHSASLTRCCATGIIWRALATRLGSTRADTTPTPSEAFATTWPQGSATSECP